MKAVSVYDLQKISFLSHLNVVDFMNPNNDHLYEDALWEMGMDTEQPIEFVVSYHRCLDRSAKVGVILVGSVRTDKQFRLSSWCSVEDRLIAAGKRDLSLAKELASMANVSQSKYGGEQALEEDELMENWMDQDEIERIEAEIEALGLVLKNVRGEQHKRNGGLKTLREYHEVEPYEKQRKKKRYRSTLKHRIKETGE